MEKKIDALKKTIYNLENDVYPYAWHSCNTCNCGVLAKTLLGGKNPIECGMVGITANVKKGAFSGFMYQCATSGLPLPEVFAVLDDAGFTYQELNHLEFLSNPIIASKLGLRIIESPNGGDYMETAGLEFTEKLNLIRYLKAWVEILEEEKLNSEQKVQARNHSCSYTPPELKSELIGGVVAGDGLDAIPDMIKDFIDNPNKKIV